MPIFFNNCQNVFLVKKNKKNKLLKLVILIWFTFNVVFTAIYRYLQIVAWGFAKKKISICIPYKFIIILSAKLFSCKEHQKFFFIDLRINLKWDTNYQNGSFQHLIYRNIQTFSKHFRDLGIGTLNYLIWWVLVSVKKVNFFKTLFLHALTLNATVGFESCWILSPWKFISVIFNL